MIVKMRDGGLRKEKSTRNYYYYYHYSQYRQIDVERKRHADCAAGRLG